jgi:AraC family transcriptional regulator, regulatory protein of adaptative response / methylated-DNA-[protein]-cysteine methyltransferase
MQSMTHAPASPEVIRFTLRPCSLGMAAVAVSDKGVCAILLGDDADTLRDELQRRFPRASLRRGADTDNIAAAALALIDGRQPPTAFAVDARGTAFQRRVWDALQSIPPGRTASYAEIADTIGAPTATRAVAGACAANPVAVAIPCHRVLRSDGALSGYRWGVERKRALLAREGRNVS